MSELYSDEWHFVDDTVSINKDDNLNPETMICEYGMEGWMNKGYKGTDPMKISSTNFKRDYKKVFVRK